MAVTNMHPLHVVDVLNSHWLILSSGFEHCITTVFCSADTTLKIYNIFVSAHGRRSKKNSTESKPKILPFHSRFNSDLIVF